MAVVSSDGEGFAPTDADAAAPRIPVFGALSDAIEHERPRWFIWVPVWFGSGIGGYFALVAEPSGMMAAAFGRRSLRAFDGDRPRHCSRRAGERLAGGSLGV